MKKYLLLAALTYMGYTVLAFTFVLLFPILMLKVLGLLIGG